MENNRKENLVIPNAGNHIATALITDLVALIGLLLIGVDGLKAGLGFSDSFRALCKEIAQIAPHFPAFIALIPTCYKLVLIGGIFFSIFASIHLSSSDEWITLSLKRRVFYFCIFIVSGILCTFMLVYETTRCLDKSVRYTIGLCLLYIGLCLLCTGLLLILRLLTRK